MHQFIGADFPGIISGITNFGIFVTLENSVEGLIRLEHLRDDFYTFDEERYLLCGERTGKIYRIGDSMTVTVVQTDLLSRTIDLLPADYVDQSGIAAFQKPRHHHRRSPEKPKQNHKTRRREKRHGTNRKKKHREHL